MRIDDHNIIMETRSAASIPNSPSNSITLFIENGKLKQKDESGTVIDLSLTGSGGGGVTLTSYEIDFGNTPVSSALFTITEPLVDSTKRVLVFPNSDTATGRKGNDWEWDMPFFSTVSGTGSFTLNATFNHLIVGKRKILYQVV